MAKSVSFTRTWIGLGMAAALVLGCQEFLGQENKTPVPAGDVTSDPPAEMALKLAMKETDECRALRAQVLAADAAGEATVTLRTDFIRNCIEEVKSSDAAGKVIISADLIPDDRTRCRWLVSEIEGGREELVVKFRYYCPDDCDTLRLVDSARHANVCRDPKPDCDDLKARLASMDPKSEEYARLRLFLSEHCGARDTLRPPKDTVPTDCETLRKRISRMDTASEDYHRAVRLYREKCLVQPPKDTVIVPPAPCDSMRRLLGDLDPASEEYALLKRRFEANCTVKPPVDTLDPVLTSCDSLKRRLSAVDTASVEYDRILALLREKCGRPDTVIVKPPRPDCDSLRRVLASHPDTASETYMQARRLFHANCGEDKPPVDTLPTRREIRCDSLRLTLSTLDPASEEYARLKRLWQQECVDPKPVDPAPPASLGRCDSLRLRLSGLDPASEEYARAKAIWYQECLEPKPINDPVICRHLMSRYGGMEPTAREYPFLRHEIALRCPEVLPADPVKPVDPPPVSRECEDIRNLMALADMTAEEYTRLKTLYSEKCLH